MDFLTQPWPWYVVGPLIGLTVPLLLILGNKSFGISSSLRHVCASCAPANIPFLQYNWRSHFWNMFFVAGIALGGFIGWYLLSNQQDVVVAEGTRAALENLGIETDSGLVPASMFSIEAIGSWPGILTMVIGGFLVGFGTRYAGGCTSGHAIMGLSNLQWPSLVAVIGFFAGGLLMVHILYPILLG